MSFKIYPINLIIVGLILLPNLLFIFFPPVHIPTEKEKPIWWVLIIIMERLGQIGVFTLPLFWEVKINDRMKYIALILMIISIAVYYIGWLRYLSGECEFKLLFSPLFALPIPLAISPILYFFFTGIMLKSWPMILATVILAAGHIPESLRNYLLSCGK